MEEYQGMPLRDAGARPLLPIGTICLTIKQGSNVSDLPGVAVVEACPLEMLLGSDYLEKVGGFINYRTGEWVHETPRLQGNVCDRLTSEEDRL